MLRKLVGRSKASILDEGRAVGLNNKTAESDLIAEFSKMNAPSLPMSVGSGGKDEPGSTGMRTQRVPGDGELKYVVRWQRARAKLKSRLMLSKLRKELNLFGSNLDYHRPSLNQPTSATSVAYTRCVLPPRSCFLDIWQLILSLSILYTATVFPFRMAFMQNNENAIVILDLIVDMCFVFDIGINLNLAFFGGDFELVTSRKRIFKRYLKGWLLFDIVSCLPVATSELWLGGTAADQGSYSELLRLLRLPRLYRLVKIIRILDVTTPSGQNRILERCKDVLKLNHGSVKMLTTVLMIFIAIHIASCFWFLTARISEFSPDTWVVRLGEANAGVTSNYIASMYWAVTTLATVGYGDINGFTNTERLMCICWMFCGIYFFSFTIGSLTSFLSGIDTK